MKKRVTIEVTCTPHWRPGWCLWRTGLRIEHNPGFIEWQYSQYPRFGVRNADLLGFLPDYSGVSAVMC